MTFILQNSIIVKNFENVSNNVQKTIKNKLKKVKMSPLAVQNSQIQQTNINYKDRAKISQSKNILFCF